MVQSSKTFDYNRISVINLANFIMFLPLLNSITRRQFSNFNLPKGNELN